MFFFLYHFFDGATGSAIRTDVLYDPNLYFSPLIHDLHGVTRFQPRLYPDKPAAKPTWLKLLRLVGAGDAEYSAVVKPDAHIGYAG